MVGSSRVAHALANAFVVLFAGALLLACGAATPPRSPIAAPVGTVTPTLPASTPAQARRGPSEELRKRWAFEARPRSMVYADLGGLLRTDLVRGLVPPLLATVKGLGVGDVIDTCLRGAVAGLEEVALGMDERGILAVVRYDTASKWTPASCLQGNRNEPARIAGAKEAFVVDRMIIAFVPGVVIIGSDDRLVTSAVAGREKGTTLADLTLDDDAYAIWNVDLGKDDLKIKGSLVASRERFRIGVDVDMPSEKEAKAVERMAAEALAGVTGVKGDEGKALERLLGAVVVKRTGTLVSAVFDLRESPAEQARDLGALAALSTFAVRKYIANAKAAEAKNAIGQIVKDIVTDWEREDGKPRSKRRLVAFPPVPKTVPRGVKYASTPADWKPWARIQFEMGAPQYFQYEVKVTDGGEGAEVIAHGDLNGDGKTSTFKLALRIDRTRDILIVEPSIHEQDPEE